jgi:hypothetical protein
MKISENKIVEITLDYTFLSQSIYLKVVEVQKRIETIVLNSAAGSYSQRVQVRRSMLSPVVVGCCNGSDIELHFLCAL